MTTRSLLLDTNHATPLVDGSPWMLKRLREEQANVVLCWPIVGELWAGVAGSSDRRRDENRQRLDLILTAIDVLPFDAAAARAFGQIKQQLKETGRPIPAIDIQLAAIAVTHAMPILSADRHLSYVDSLQVIDWTS
ncbi:MAG: PIN domain-containing protein [Planctomycetota bacterium]